MARLPVDLMTLSDRQALPSGQVQVDSASAADFGGQVGQALGGMANAGAQLAGKIQANQRQVQAFDYEKRFSEIQQEDNLAYETRVRGMSGSAENHWTAARAETATRFDTWLKTLPEKEQADYASRAQEFQNRRVAGAFQDQYKQQDASVRTSISEEQRKAGLQVQQNPQSYDTYVAAQEKLIDASPLTSLEKTQRKLEIRNALAFTAEQEKARRDPTAYVVASEGGLEGPKALIRRKEGFRETPYWDQTAWRAGYGSDTTTKADGTKVKVQQGVKITREDAERDLDRRVSTEFIPAAVEAIGADAWKKLSPSAQAVMASLSYNYGAGAWTGGPNENRNGAGGALSRVAAAAKAGDPQGIADAVRALAGHNGGVNAKRRNSEADLVLNGKSVGDAPSGAAASLTAQQSAVVNETARNELASQERQAAAQREADVAALRNQVFVDLKESASPEEAYRQARGSGVLTDVDDIEKAERVMETRRKTDSDFNVGAAVMAGGAAVANPFDKDQKAGVAAFYERGVKSGMDGAALAASVFDRTGIVVPQFATSIRGALVSQDENRVGAALVTATNMVRKNPNAFAGVEGTGEIEKNVSEFKRLTDTLGMSTEEATKRILADARDPSMRDPVKDEQVAEFKKTSLKQASIDTRLQDKFNGQMPLGPQRTAIASIYGQFAEEGFQQFRDPVKALAFADMRVEQQFGTQNGIIMRYPPSKSGLPALPGSGDNGHAWINQQAVKYVKEEFGVVVDADQIVLLPVDRQGVSTAAAFGGKPMDVNRRDGKQGQQTSFQSVPYQIQVMPKTAEQQILSSAMAFFPDIETYVADKNAEIAVENLNQPLMGYDVFGDGFVVQPHQREYLNTPKQVERRAKAELKKRVAEGRAASLLQNKESDVADALLKERGPLTLSTVEEEQQNFVKQMEMFQ